MLSNRYELAPALIIVILRQIRRQSHVDFVVAALAGVFFLPRSYGTFLSTSEYARVVLILLRTIASRQRYAHMHARPAGGARAEEAAAQPGRDDASHGTRRLTRGTHAGPSRQHATMGCHNDRSCPPTVAAVTHF